MSLDKTDYTDNSDVPAKSENTLPSDVAPLVREAQVAEAREAPRRKYAAPSAPRVLNCMRPAGTPKS